MATDTRAPYTKPTPVSSGTTAQPGNPGQATPGLGDTHSGSPTSQGLTTAQQSAWDILQATLAAYQFTGTQLTQLVAWAKQEVISGNDPALIALQLQQQPAFIQRFPAIEARLKAGLPPISAAEYLANERTYSQLERAAGIPPNFASYDQLIAADVSPTEFADRINKGYLAVAQADPTVVKAFQDYYGVTAGQLAAHFLDPTKSAPLLEQQAVAAQIGGASAQSAFKATTALPEGISQAQALRLAQMGVTQPVAQQGFQTLSAEQQLYSPLPGGGHVGTTPTTDQLLNAQFGSDGQTKLQLELQAGFEKGTTNEGVAVGKTAQGATGVSSVQR